MLKKIILQLILFLAPKWVTLPGLTPKQYLIPKPSTIFYSNQRLEMEFRVETQKLEHVLQYWSQGPP